MIDITVLKDGETISSKTDMALDDEILWAHGGRFLTPVTLDFTALMLDGGDVAVCGKTVYRAEFVCDRCGKTFAKTVSGKLNCVYSVRPEEDEYKFDGTKIDLTEACGTVRESAVYPTSAKTIRSPF